MFGKQTDPSRTEQATPKRRSKNREEGNVPKSAELGKAVSLTAGVLCLYALIGPMTERIKALYRHFLGHAWEFDPNPENVYSLSLDLMAEVAKLILPVLLPLALCALAAQRLQVGKLWTTKVFKPKLQRFNLIKGLKQMFLSPQTLLRSLKSLLFSLILTLIPGYVLYAEYENFLPMYYATSEGVAAYMLRMAFKLAWYALLPILAIAAFDVWQTRFAYNEGMKMTKDEVKDEQKQAEGDPIIKGQQRKKNDGRHVQAHAPERAQGRRGGDQPHPHCRGPALQYRRGSGPGGAGQGGGPPGGENQGNSPRKSHPHQGERALGTSFV